MCLQPHVFHHNRTLPVKIHNSAVRINQNPLVIVTGQVRVFFSRPKFFDGSHMMTFETCH